MRCGNIFTNSIASVGIEGVGDWISFGLGEELLAAK